MPTYGEMPGVDGLEGIRYPFGEATLFDLPFNNVMRFNFWNDLTIITIGPRTTAMTVHANLHDQLRFGAKIHMLFLSNTTAHQIAFGDNFRARISGPPANQTAAFSFIFVPIPNATPAEPPGVFLEYTAFSAIL